MNYTEVTRVLYSYAQRYFTGATVTMANTRQVKKTKPLVTLEFGPQISSQFPVESDLDGELCRFHPTSMKLEVQLFTNGRPLSNGAPENTAVADLTDFAMFMVSEMVTEELGGDISVLVDGPVQDVSAIINDASYEYRAMVEFTVSYVVASVGFAGILDESSIKADPEPDPEHPGQVIPPHIDQTWTPTDSGGRNADDAERRTGYFTEVEIENYKKE